jgi:hypothetical protein
LVGSYEQNYRIALPNPDVRKYAETDQLDPLLAADQVRNEAIDRQRD